MRINTAVQLVAGGFGVTLMVLALALGVVLGDSQELIRPDVWKGLVVLDLIGFATGTMCVISAFDVRF